jgi:peptidoglycan/LPS O-acetylase OafA/YrhL
LPRLPNAHRARIVLERKQYARRSLLGAYGYLKAACRRGFYERCAKNGRVREHAATGTEVWDGLRGIAILLVLAYHTWLFSWYTPKLALFGVALPVATPVRTGYLGVEVFFVISGFVLFLPYARRMVLGTTKPAVAEFARRRFLKIVPSYALALLFTVFSALSLTPKPESLLGTIANHVAFVQNFYGDELGVANSVFWSLAIEVQFYLIFPLVAWAFMRRPTLIAGAMIAIAVIYRAKTDLCCAQFEQITRQLPAFLDLFACGMLAAWLLVRLRAAVPDIRKYALVCTLLAWAAIGAGWWLLSGADKQTYVPTGREHWVASYRTLFGIAVATFGLASSFAFGWWRRLIANPVLTFLALVSYNLYLWHTLVLIWMWKHDFPPAATPEPHDDPHWKIVYIASGWICAIAVATAITYFIERPLLPGRQPFSFDWRPGRLPSIAPREKRT